MSTPARNTNSKAANAPIVPQRQSLLVPPNPTVIRRKRQEHAIARTTDGSPSAASTQASVRPISAAPVASLYNAEPGNHSRNPSRSTIMGVINAGYLDSISETQGANGPQIANPNTVPFPSSGASSPTDPDPSSPPPPPPEREGSPVLSTKSSHQFSAFDDDGGRYPPDSFPTKQSSASKVPHFVKRSLRENRTSSHRRQGAVNWAGVIPVPLRRAERSRNRVCFSFKRSWGVN
jgi:hypothetical protein